MNTINNSTPPVVITGTLTQSLNFYLTQLGRKTVAMPLLKIEQLKHFKKLHSVLNQLNQYTLVIFVSPNAIHSVFQHIQYWPKNVMIGVMGQSSQLALKQYGIKKDNTTIISPISDEMGSKALLQSLNLNYLQGKSVLIIRAQTGNKIIENMLKKITVHYLTAYKRFKLPLNYTTKIQLKKLIDLDSEWIITSSEGLRHLLALTNLSLDLLYVSKLKKQKIFVSHHRIERIAQSLGFSNIMRIELKKEF